MNWDYASVTIGVTLVAIFVLVVAVFVVPGLTWYARAKEWVKRPNNLRHTTLTVLAVIWFMLGTALGSEGVNDIKNLLAMAVITLVGWIVYRRPVWREARRQRQEAYSMGFHRWRSH